MTYTATTLASASRPVSSGLPAAVVQALSAAWTTVENRLTDWLVVPSASPNPFADALAANLAATRARCDGHAGSATYLTERYRNVVDFYQRYLAIDVTQVVPRAVVAFDPLMTGLNAGLAAIDTSFPPRRVVVRSVTVNPQLSTLATEGVLAHEFFHVLSAHANYDLPNEMEEGCANLVEYLYLKVHDSGESRHLQAQMLANPHPAYGDGFRIARAVYKQSRGLRHCMQKITAMYVSRKE